MAWPIFRTALPQSHDIRWPECLAGYVAIPIGMPALALMLQGFAIALLKGSGITHSPVGPVAQQAEFMVEALIFSFSVSWIGCILSIPVVWMARRQGWFGWGTAMITGVVMMLIVMPFPSYSPGNIVANTTALGLPSALLGLSFWLTGRLMRPSAFE